MNGRPLSESRVPSETVPAGSLAEARERQRRIVLLVLTGLYVALMVRAQHNKLEGFGMGFDLAMYEQVIWNTSHGRLFESSALGETRVHLGRDLILVELFLAVPYALFPSTYTLFVLQTLSVAAGALVVYVLARKHLGGDAALLMAGVYLAYLPLQFLNLYEFQPRAFAIAPALLAFHFLEEERLRPFVLSLLAMLSTRSDLALTVVMLGVLALVHRRPRRFVFWPLVLGIAWFLVAVGLVVPYFNPQGEFLYLQWFKPEDPEAGRAFATPADLFTRLSAPKSGRFFLAVYGPLAFLPFFRPDILLVSLPLFGLGALSTNPMFLDIRYQYVALLYPTAFVATIYALPFLTARGRGRFTPTVLRRGLLLAIAFGTALSYVFQYSPLLQWNRTSPAPNRVRALRRAIERIPAEAAVAAGSCVAPFLAGRERLYHFPPLDFARGFYATDLRKVDYVVADRRCDPEAVAALADGPGFVRELERSSVVLYRRRGVGEVHP